MVFDTDLHNSERQCLQQQRKTFIHVEKKERHSFKKTTEWPAIQFTCTCMLVSDAHA